VIVFFFSSRRRHTRLQGDWSSDVCSSDLLKRNAMLRQKVMIDDPFIASWRLGIQSAKSPPRSRFCRRPQFAQEFKRNVGALNPVRPLRTALLYVFVQLFN